MKNSKLMRVVIILLLLIIIGLGITATVFFFMNKSNVNKLNDMIQAKNDCDTQIAEKDLKIAELETTRDNLQKSLDDINNKEFSNFVYDYKKYSTDSVKIMDYGTDVNGISVAKDANGVIEMCVHDDKYVSRYSGDVSWNRKLVEGISGEVSKAYVCTVGHGYTQHVLFLLENGKVQYLDQDAFLKGEFVVGGTLDVEKVVDIMQVSVTTPGPGYIAFATIDVNGNVKVFDSIK